jgi:hypothetical protein
MNPIQQSEVNIVEVCEAGQMAAMDELRHIEEKIVANWEALEQRERTQLQTIRKLENSKREIVDTITKVSQLGVAAPDDLKDKVTNLEKELITIKKNYEESPEYIELQRNKQMFETEKEATKTKVDNWTKKLAVAKHLSSQYEKSLKVEHHRHILGLSKVRSFKTLAEAKSAYFSEIPIVLHVETDGSITKATYWKDCASTEHITSTFNNHPRYIVKEIPKSLNWIKRLDSFKSMTCEDDSEIPQVDGVYFIRLEQKNTGNQSEIRNQDNTQTMIARWDNKLLSHDPYFYFNGFFYVESEKEFYGVWPKDIEDGEIKFKNGYATLENECKFDASKIFQDFKEYNTWNEDSLPEEIARRQNLAIQQLATTTPVFEPRNIRLPADLIEKEVGMYWNAFISSPWANEINGAAVIMLKHLCERGIETPHIWTLEHKGHYGFRVRTRDHSWITGKIYCPPSALGRTSPIIDEVVYIPQSREFAGRIVKVGEAAIYVKGFEKDER